MKPNTQHTISTNGAKHKTHNQHNTNLCYAAAAVTVVTAEEEFDVLVE